MVRPILLSFRRQFGSSIIAANFISRFYFHARKMREKVGVSLKLLLRLNVTLHTFWTELSATFHLLCRLRLILDKERLSLTSIFVQQIKCQARLCPTNNLY